MDFGENLPLYRRAETSAAKVKYTQSSSQKAATSSVSTISKAATASVIASIAISTVV